MHVDPLGPGKYHVSFFDATEFVTTYTQQIMRGTLFLPGEEFPKPGAPCGAVLLFPVNDDRVELSATLDRVAEAQPKGAHLKLDPLPDEVRAGIEAFLTEVLRGQMPPVRFKGEADSDTSDLDPTLLADDAEPSEADEALLYRQHASGKAHAARSIHAQIKEMSVQQKIKAALSGGKAARAVLIKDPQRVVHQYVLKNPRLTTDEIAQIAKNPGSSIEVVRLIATNQQWMGDATIRWNIIRNPKTNTQLAVSYLSRLPLSQITQLAKSQNVKGALSKAAFKLLEAKGKRG